MNSFAFGSAFGELEKSITSYERRTGNDGCQNWCRKSHPSAGSAQTIDRTQTFTARQFYSHFLDKRYIFLNNTLYFFI